MTTFDVLALFGILLVTFAGGYPPLFRRKTDGVDSYPGGEAFTSGIFLALALVIMLPEATTLLNKAWHSDFPSASVIAVLFFFLLLSLEHMVAHLRLRMNDESQLAAPIIPVVMVFMIAIPSFFMGTALGLSTKALKWYILVAILAHKGSAGFALALEMVKSRLSPRQRLGLYSGFAMSTPFGIICGSCMQGYLVTSGPMPLIKGMVLAMAAGTFLYLGTLHELKQAPLITHCTCRRNFLWLLFGFGLTVGVRFLLGVH
ncbi:MAG: ZIP family metal transporter [Victivallales bacterium]|nr:ZIP family metal transporter [Victivallales bacterium]